MKTILIVDDELAIAQSLALILEEEGYHTVCASNGLQAQERIAARKPDLIVLDFVMPVLGGAELGRWLRADARTRDLPIVMNSSLPEETVRAGFDGYDAFLRKPYTIFQLLDLVQKLLTAK